VLSGLLLILVFFMYGLAIFLAKGHRRETLRKVAWSFAVVGLLVLLVRRFVRNQAVDALASPAYRGPVRDLWLIGSSILHQIGIATVIYGLAAVAGALLEGPTRRATSARRHLPGSVYGAKDVVYSSDAPERRAVLQVAGSASTSRRSVARVHLCAMMTRNGLRRQAAVSASANG